MSTRVWVKICGLSTPQAVATAVAAHADAVGFVFAPGSPRTVSPTTARVLGAGVPVGVETVGVFRGQLVDEVLRMAREAGVATVQLHGDEHPDVFDDVRAAGFGVVRALSAERYSAESEDARAAFGDVRLLLDAPEPGAGRSFDASELALRPPAGPWILAGGLTPDNVGRLVSELAPSGVDVSSGVESARGVKDIEAIQRFVAAARA